MARYVIHYYPQGDVQYPWEYQGQLGDDTARDFGTVATWGEALACVQADDRLHAECSPGYCPVNDDGSEH